MPEATQTAVDLTPFFVAAGLPAPQREVHYGIPGRKFAADYAWPSWKVAFEREGGDHHRGQSRHTRAAGYAHDCEKYNLAQLLGWIVIRATPAQIDSGHFLVWVEMALVRRDWRSPKGTYYSLRE